MTQVNQNVLTCWPFIQSSWDFRLVPVGADAWHVEWDVLDLTAVGDRAELDDGVKRDLQPRQILLVRLQKVAEQTSEKKVSNYPSKLANVHNMAVKELDYNEQINN